MATIIDLVTAKSLIKEYQSQNTAVGGPAIVTPGGLPLNGFFLDRASLETLLADPNVAGISLHLAKDPSSAGSAGHQFTVLFTGATGAKAPYIASGNIYDAPPCPPSCTTLP